MYITETNVNEGHSIQKRGKDNSVRFTFYPSEKEF